MPCAAPIRAYQRSDGGPLLFTAPNTNNGAHTYKALEIPCGYCILCRQEHARQVGVRIVHEATQWEHSCFVTLTYDDEHLPKYNSLDYSHLQKFWKRLRKNYGPMRYYAVGEYGDDTQRPHYHACIFGHAFTANRTILQNDPLMWTNPVLAGAWGHGNVSVMALNFQTAQYTASYVLKKLTKAKQYVRIDETTGELIRLVQPHAFMSKNIGKDWWIKYGGHTTAHDFVVINGRKQKPPKAYDRWLGEVDEQKLKDIKQKRKEQTPAETPEQRRARARNAHARARNKSKKL